jgi:hypothetical protein
MYALDSDKIRAGEDRRTTLMIKNIPNKYTQVRRPGLRFRDESIAIAMNRRVWASGVAMVSGFATCGSR